MGPKDNLINGDTTLSDLLDDDSLSYEDEDMWDDWDEAFEEDDDREAP